MRTTTPNPTHPAKFSDPIVEQLDRLVRAEQRRVGRELIVVDPFAGVGRIHRLARPGKVRTIGVEIEPEWAACHEATICADALEWLRGVSGVDVVATSPCYGNRLADSHEAKDGSVRHSYTHDLGRPLSDGSAGALHWGPAYWSFHAAVYRLIAEALRPGGLVLLNVSDFVRRGERTPASMWHRGALAGAGLVESSRELPRVVETRRLRYGANADARAAAELIIRARRPERSAAGRSGRTRTSSERGSVALDGRSPLAQRSAASSTQTRPTCAPPWPLGRVCSELTRSALGRARRTI